MLAAPRPVLLATLLLGACAAPATFDVGPAGTAKLLELQLDARGALVQIEYHVPPEDLPQAVREAMDRHHPGDALLLAEIEVRGALTLYELTRQVDGRKVEALFRADGALVEEELEIDAAQVPAVVRDRVRARFPRGSGWVFEEVRNDQQRLIEYHIKVQQDGWAYKTAVYQNGHVRTIWREVAAEVEVPIE